MQLVFPALPTDYQTECDMPDKNEVCCDKNEVSCDKEIQYHILYPDINRF